MEQSEIDLLKKVLPEPWEVVNEFAVKGNDYPIAVWDGDIIQHSISSYATAKEVITWILRRERECAEIGARIHVQHTIKEALGIREDINAAVKVHNIRDHAR